MEEEKGDHRSVLARESQIVRWGLRGLVQRGASLTVPSLFWGFYIAPAFRIYYALPVKNCDPGPVSSCRAMDVFHIQGWNGGGKVATAHLNGMPESPPCVFPAFTSTITTTTSSVRHVTSFLSEHAKVRSAKNECLLQEAAKGKRSMMISMEGSD